jgi:hypothetical protein
MAAEPQIKDVCGHGWRLICKNGGMIETRSQSLLRFKLWHFPARIDSLCTSVEAY